MAPEATNGTAPVATGGIGETGNVEAGRIDCDVHLVVPAVEVLLPYLSTYWQETIRETAFAGPEDTSYPAGAAISVDAKHARPDGLPAGSDLEQTRAAVLEAGAAGLGVLTCSYAIESIRNPFAAAALARAVNDWQVEQWLEREPRLRGSVVVASQDPALAAEEIQRVGGHPGFVQVHLPVRADAPYGNRRYYPVWEAALAHDLAIGIHAGGQPGAPPTAVGWPSYFVEEYVGMIHVFQSQLISIVTGGVFDRYPDLRMALIESGVSWLPSLCWRLDKEWKGLRREVPWVRRLPSDYIREHVRLTTWPFDGATDPARVGEIVDQIGSDEMLLYATDFPHDHDELPPDAVLAALPEATARKIERDNALSFYRLT